MPADHAEPSDDGAIGDAAVDLGPVAGVGAVTGPGAAAGVGAAASAAAVRIDDPDDARLDDFRDLSSSDRRPDLPGGKGLVIAEGVPVVERLLASPYPVRAVMGVPARLAQLRLGAVPVFEVPVEVMDSVVGFHLNRGVLAAADRIVQPSFTDIASRARRLLVLEGVGDHENLGSLFRNAAAFGFDAVVLGPRCSDPLYRRAVRVSMGNVLRVLWCSVPARDWPAALGVLHEHGFETLALTPRSSATALAELDPALERAAVLVGAEGPGLTDEALAAASCQVRIPMAAGVDSLNVATAAAVAMHHLSHLLL